MRCRDWEFEMGTFFKTCRCREIDDDIAAAFVEREGRRWVARLSVRKAPNTRWRQLPSCNFPSERTAKYASGLALQTYMRRMCREEMANAIRFPSSR